MNKKPSARTVLDRIRRKQLTGIDDPYDIMSVVDPQPKEIKIAKAHPSADDWQEFKRKFVEEYGGEKVEATGMTHSELLHYIKTSGERENSKLIPGNRIKQILRDMGEDV
jgi:hypothetical protein